MIWIQASLAGAWHGERAFAEELELLVLFDRTAKQTPESAILQLDGRFGVYEHGARHDLHDLVLGEMPRRLAKEDAGRAPAGRHRESQLGEEEGNLRKHS